MNKKRALLIITILSLSGLLIWGYYRSLVEDLPARHPVPISFSKPRVRIDLEDPKSNISTAQQRLLLSDGFHTSDFKSLDQLRGLVEIKSKDQALEFVRLRTSQCLCYNWAGQIQLEVINTSQIDDPNFADAICPRSPNNHGQSGLYAILSQQAYQQGGFAPPMVISTANGYAVTRWVCTFDDLAGSRVERWREIVGLDGSYRKAVLVSKKPPKLPNTEWYVMGLA